MKENDLLRRELAALESSRGEMEEMREKHAATMEELESYQELCLQALPPGSLGEHKAFTSG